MRQMYSNPCTGLEKPWRFQEFEDPRFHDNRHMKVVRLSALMYQPSVPHQKIFLVPICLGGWVYPRAIVRPEGLYQWKLPKTPSRIEPATFGIVAHMYRKTMDSYKRVTYKCNNTIMVSILHGHLAARGNYVAIIIIIIIIFMWKMPHISHNIAHNVTLFNQ